MAGKLYAHGEEARRALIRGIDLVAELVAPTLGPRGSHVIVQRLDAPPLITNDGVTIVRSLEMLRDPMTNQGVQLLREVASTTEDFVGDGTTTATLLARAIVRGAFARVAAGADPMALGEGIAGAVAEVVEWLQARSRPASTIEDVRRVARVAARDDHIGGLVAEALEAVGADGVVRVEDDPAYGVRLEIHEGLRFESGLISPALATNVHQRETVFEDPYILLASERIDRVAQLAPVLSAVAEQKRPLVIVADEVSGEALTLLVLNIRRRGLPVAAVKAPDFGPDREAALADMAARTGGVVFGPGLGRCVDRATLDGLGRAGRAIVTPEWTAIAEGRGDAAAIAGRKREIRALLALEESEYERDKLRTRLARLDGALAIVRIGLDSETEQDETRHRIRDAVQAGRAAITDGVVPGGGAALLQAALAMRPEGAEEQRAGCEVVRRALEAPLRQLAVNAGMEPSVAVRQVAAAPFGHGLDIARRELCDLIEAGIFDPVKVVCSSLEIAASIACICLRSEAIIADRPLQIRKRAHHPHGHHHHGDPEGHTHDRTGHAHHHDGAHDGHGEPAEHHGNGHDEASAARLAGAPAG
ncbi:MAG: chaperonin GroEL [Solirubrobacteraceae bacterium]|nr:chaperonin GroEL [Solirubrobacteraceae bacterium]